MQSSPAAVVTLRTLLTAERLAVVATQQNGQPYTSLVAFVASDDLRCIAFVTGRATTKYRNLFAAPRVSMLIDSRTHSVEDFTAGSAVTVLGRAAEIVDKRGSALLSCTLACAGVFCNTLNGLAFVFSAAGCRRSGVHREQ